MIRLLWTASAEVRYFLRRHMPSNIVLDLIRTRKGLKWGVPAILLAGPYLAVAFWCTTLIENGSPGWLHLVVLLCIWNALKMVAVGPVSVVLLLRARAREYRAQRQQRQELSEDVPLGDLTQSSRRVQVPASTADRRATACASERAKKGGRAPCRALFAASGLVPPTWQDPKCPRPRTRCHRAADDGVPHSQRS